MISLQTQWIQVPIWVVLFHHLAEIYMLSKRPCPLARVNTWCLVWCGEVKPHHSCPWQWAQWLKTSLGETCQNIFTEGPLLQKEKEKQITVGRGQLCEKFVITHTAKALASYYAEYPHADWCWGIRKVCWKNSEGPFTIDADHVRWSHTGPPEGKIQRTLIDLQYLLCGVTIYDRQRTCAI